MAERCAKIRVFVDGDLSPGAEVALDRAQSHYLTGVMRQGVGALVLVFNGRHGEWLAEIANAARKGVVLTCQDSVRPQLSPPDLWLCFAPIKRARTDFIAEKACEVGCRRIQPVFTQHTNSDRVNIERLQAHALEAAEQCGLLSVPDVMAPATLSALIEAWPEDRQILFCDETTPRPPALEVLQRAERGPWAVLTGPEGGFSEEEVRALQRMPQAHAVSLGPRILRADTAAVAALALWQAVLGDWS